LVADHDQVAGLGTDTLPNATALFVPLTGSQRTVGAVGVRPDDPQRFLDPEQRRLLETCGSLIALSIERDQSVSRLVDNLLDMSRLEAGAVVPNCQWHLLEEIVRAPIIILSARDQEKQKVAALDAGADDYLTKPFGAPELLARIRVALRHAARVTGDVESPTFESGDLKVDFAARRVFAKGQEVHLTPLEYKLLATLVYHAGKVLTHRLLLKEVWGPLQNEPHHLRVLMASLRRKIEEDSAQPRHLLTEQGVGYRLAAN
jgi:DNA-binding response OmpR family regulator